MKFPEGTIPNSNSETENNLILEEKNPPQNTSQNKHAEREETSILFEISRPFKNKQLKLEDTIKEQEGDIKDQIKRST